MTTEQVKATVFTADETTSFVSGAGVILASRAATIAAKENWTKILVDGLTRMGEVPYSKGKLAELVKIPESRLVKIGKAHDELLLAFVNSSQEARDIISAKLKMGPQTVITETVLRDYMKSKKAKDGAPADMAKPTGVIKTVYNALSEVLKKAGYDRRVTSKSDLSEAEVIAKWLENVAKANIDTAIEGVILYACNVKLGEVLEREMVQAVAGMAAASPSCFAKFLGREGALEFAEHVKAAANVEPVAQPEIKTYA